MYMKWKQSVLKRHSVKKLLSLNNVLDEVVKITIKSSAYRPMGFIIGKYYKFNYMVSDSILQLAFKKLSLVELWYSLKGEYPQLSWIYFSITPLFSSYLCEAILFHLL